MNEQDELKAEVLALSAKLRAGLFGHQKQLVGFYDLVERLAQSECPVCLRRREQTRLRVERTRIKAKKGKKHARSARATNARPAKRGPRRRPKSDPGGNGRRADLPRL